MKVNWILALRVKQLICSVVVLGLSAYVVNWYTTDTLTASPTQINFLVAVPLLSLISIAYNEGISRFAPRMFSPYVAIAIDSVNSIMYFAGFIALAVFLNGLLFCRGNVCRAARADTAFAAISWLGWTATTVLMGMSVFRNGLRKTGSGNNNPRTQGMFNSEMKMDGSRA